MQEQKKIIKFKDATETRSSWPYANIEADLSITVKIDLLNSDKGSIHSEESHYNPNDENSKNLDINLSNFSDDDWNYISLDITTSVNSDLGRVNDVIDTQHIKSAFFSYRIKCGDSRFRLHEWGVTFHCSKMKKKFKYLGIPLEESLICHAI